jgi:hypothetical protein
MALANHVITKTSGFRRQDSAYGHPIVDKAKERPLHQALLIHHINK